MLEYRYNLTIVMVYYDNDTSFLVTELITIMRSIRLHGFWMLYNLPDLFCR